jgi:uncharacterized membrane protein YjjP (DUF1212 family)
VPSEQDQRDAATYQFVAALGAAMASANYPVTMVRDAMAATSRAYGLDVQLLDLPNYVQVGSQTGDNLYIANPDFDVRYDQSFPLAKLVARAPTGAITPEEGMAELDRIRHQQRRFPVWVTVFGYAVQSAGLALILQPTPWSLVGTATLGLLVGALSVLSRRSEAIGYMLPTICAFLVASIVFTFNARWHVGVDSLRALAAPLATFLPGNALLGSYASGFGGGLTLIIFALAISHRPNTPPTVSLVLPGFWLLVPGSLGFMGVTQLLGTHTAVFTATLISMMSIAVGVQTGLLLWRAAIQLTSSPDRRAMHD